MLKKTIKQRYQSAEPVGIIQDGKKLIEIMDLPVFETDMMGFVLNKPAVIIRASGKIFDSQLREGDRFYCNGKYYTMDMIQMKGRQA